MTGKAAVQLNIRIDPELDEMLDRLAHESKETKAFVIRRILREALSNSSSTRPAKRSTTRR